MARRLLCVLILVSVLAACGDGDASRPPPRTAGTEPIILIQRRAGLAPAAAPWALPEFVLLADGTAVVRGADQGIVLSGTRRTLSAEQVAGLYRRAADAKLFQSRTFPRNILDGTTLVVRITSTAGRHETTVIQPDPHEGGDRGRIARFAADAASAGAPGGAYRPERAAVVVVAGGDDTTDVRPWPLAVAPERMPGYPSRPCLILDGDRLPALLAAVRGAGPHTRWTAGGQRLSLVVRPLLPDEQTCTDLPT
jgi:hypothetical protein